MSKVLNRKMFRQKYLGVQKPQGFQTGGVAEAAELDISDEELEKELNIEKTEPKAEPEVESLAKTEDTGFASGIAKILSLEDTSGGLTRNQKLQSYLAPIAAALLTGDQRTGESKVSGTLRALGLGMATLPGTIQAIAASDLEARKVGKEEAATAAEGTEQQISIDRALELGIILADQVDPLDTGFVKVRITTKADGSLNYTMVDSPKILQKGDKIREKFYTKTLDETDQKLMNTLNNLESLIEYYKGGDLPGVGFIDQVSPGREARNMKAAIASLENVIIKNTSGAAVSESEFKRLKDELGKGVLRNEKDLINFVYREKMRLNKTFKDKLLSVPERAQQPFLNDLDTRFHINDSRISKYVPSYAKKSEEDKAMEDGITVYDLEDIK